MVAEFLEKSVMFQTPTILKMYAVIIIVAYGIAFLMYHSAKKKNQN